MRSDAGNYVVSVTNFLLDNSSQPVGSDTGSFSLDVLCKWMFTESNECNHTPAGEETYHCT